MKNWRESVLALTLSVWLVPQLALASTATGIAPDPDRRAALEAASARSKAYADSVAGRDRDVSDVVWYSEQLEHDFALFRVRSAATVDSLRLRLEFVGQRLAWATEDRPHWYEKPALAFMGGVISALIVISQVLRISF